MPDHTWVFAYGSNMNLPDLRRWLGERGHPTEGPRNAHAACIEDYTLVWNYYSRARQGAAANVVRQTGALLYGVALEVDPTLLGAIDIKEGHPDRYSRGESPVEARLLHDDNRVRTWLYEVTPEWVHDAPVRPRQSYVRLMLEGARFHRLPAPYLDALAAIPSCEDL